MEGVAHWEDLVGKKQLCRASLGVTVGEVRSSHARSLSSLIGGQLPGYLHWLAGQGRIA